MTQTYFSPLLMLKHCPADGTVSRYASEHGWQRMHESPGNPRSAEPREIEWSVEQTLSMRYGENHFTGYCYVYASGDQPEPVQSLAGQLLHDLDVYTSEELLTAVDDAVDEPTLGATLTLLIMGSPEIDEKILERLRRGISRSSEKMRDLIVWAFSLNPQAEFRPLLRAISEYDPSIAIREKAQRMLDSYDSAGVELAEPAT